MNYKYYYTECSKAFYNKLIKEYGFSSDLENWYDYDAIRLNFSKKVITGANPGIKIYKDHYNDHIYITNEN